LKKEKKVKILKKIDKTLKEVEDKVAATKSMPKP